jgi:hypothetical protein
MKHHRHTGIDFWGFSVRLTGSEAGKKIAAGDQNEPCSRCPVVADAGPLDPTFGIGSDV